MERTLVGYYITEGRNVLRAFERNKGEALRFAAKQAQVRQSLVKVFTVQGYFVKSFDGRK